MGTCGAVPGAVLCDGGGCCSLGMADGATMNILGLIPARGGSKGILRKNLTPLCGRPLIAWTIDAAKSAPSLTHLACSTDDPEIAKLAWAAGIKVIDRPTELAADQSPVIHAVEHALAQLNNTEFDAVFLLQPTNPLRTAADIEAAVEIFHRTQADSVISYIPCGDRHPYRMREIHSNRVIKPNFAEPRDGMPRQQMPEYYLRTGEVYLTRAETIHKRRNLVGERCVPYLIPKERAWNVDEPLDLVIAGAMMRKIHLSLSPLQDITSIEYMGPDGTARTLKVDKC